MNRSYLRVSILIGFMELTMLCCSGSARAGSLDSPAGPDNASSGMYSLQDLKNRLATGAAGAKRVAGFTEPAAGPGPTGASLNDIMALMPSADTANGATVGEVLSGKTFWGLRTDGTWGLQTGTGSGPAPSGTASEADVLAGKTFSNTSGTGKTGTMADRGFLRINNDLTQYSWEWDFNSFPFNMFSIYFPDGYYAGIALPVDDNLQAGNIRSGVSIYGVTGTMVDYSSTPGTAVASDMCVGNSAWVNGQLVQGTLGCPRFYDNNNGTVTDRTQRITWQKTPNPCGGRKNWDDATACCSSLASGSGGLTDGSTAGQWRLPSPDEFSSAGTTALNSAPFAGVDQYFYWTNQNWGGGAATGYDCKWGGNYITDTYNLYDVWCVR